jgi:hypothetical protein
MDLVLQEVLLRKEIVKPGLMTWLRFSEGQGQSTYDMSDNRYIARLGSTDGADSNDPTWAVEGLSFSADDYVAATISGTIKNIGIAFYIAEAITKSSTGQALVSPGNNGATNRFLGIGDMTALIADEIICIGDEVNGRSSWTGDGQINAGWNYIDINWNNTIYQINLNNWVMPVTKTNAPIALTGNALVIAALSLSPSKYFTGKIAYLVMYNRSLSGAERNKNYKAIKQALLRRGAILNN